MESIDHIFGNSGDAVHNDVILDRLFELENNTYTFLLQPKTKF
jgi:hypothetical protein